MSEIIEVEPVWLVDLFLEAVLRMRISGYARFFGSSQFVFIREIYRWTYDNGATH